ncbi:MAG: exopolysaccharide biosynthesis protein [Opitutaceae bacterium]
MSIPPVTGPRAPKLSEEMAALQQRYAERPVKLGELIVELKGRAYSLLLIFLALPFVTPIPLPGLSTPFGLAIAIIALRLSLGQAPWLPQSLQGKEIPAGFFGKVFSVATRVIRFMERFMKPRWTVFFSSGLIIRLHAFLMVVAAAVLLLPLPIPFTNSFPAWVIVLVAGGLLERDGLAVMLGYLVFASGVLYFVFLGEVAEHLMRSALEWIAG